MGVASLIAFSVGNPAGATVIVSSLPDFNGPRTTTGFPLPAATAGTFTYIIPLGEHVTSATLSGTWGTAAFSLSTAGLKLFVDGTFTGQCVAPDVSCYRDGAALRPFSFSVPTSGLSLLDDGSAVLSEVQTSSFHARLGTPKLTLITSPIPEPASMALVGAGLLGLGLARRKPG